ncbi:uncharacterized protein STEHIDRAFT_32774, partial [Stereum hirsutum FP-91666 SS1]|uniref:uncharacterized protein n=1 Tax=Stereum hirsutum (strain FP-91666) TaxID=721885 RepID=UPI000444A5E7
PVPPSAKTAGSSPPSKVALVERIKLDEAFVDFWSDALLDPIASDWPKFVLCQLKPIPALQEPKPVTWLVIEQAFVRPPPPRSPTPTGGPAHERSSSEGAASAKSGNGRATSPTARPSIRTDGGRVSSTISATKKRLSFWAT